MAETPSEGSARRKKRCYSGCAVCRARKVKCDERPGGCANCERLQLKCPGNDLEQLPSVDDLKLPHSQAGGKRNKTYRSCGQCRASKTRCSGDRPVCSRCKRKKQDCVYDSDPDPAWARAVFRDSAKWGATGTPNEDGKTEDAPSVAVTSDRQQSDVASDTRSKVSYDVSVRVGWDSINWLHTKDLPDEERLFRLVDQYFSNIHPLRCFGFIHKPSFMQRLDEGITANKSESALLYTVCALGAKFYALDYSINTRRLLPHEILSAGNEWAKEAQRLIFSDLDVISIEKLMAAVLLHDHELRCGKFASAFMLCGISTRMAQALQMNVEYSTDVLCTYSSDGPSPAARESRRRLMWATYIMDAWVGSGVDQLTLLDESDIKIQLPSTDQGFSRQTPSITETLEPGCILNFLSREIIDSNPAENMGMAAYFVRLTAYRRRVLRYVKQLDKAQPPWLSGSEFSQLDRSLRLWYETLPSTLRFTTSVQYMRKDSSQLGALCLLHCTYHQTMCDLHRIGLPRLYKIRTKVHYPPERLDFLATIQQTSFNHASEIAKILQAASRHGVKTLADSWLSVVAHDTNRLMMYYLTKTINPNAIENRQTVKESLPLISSNLEILKAMSSLFSMSKSLYEASTNMVRQSGLGDNTSFAVVIAGGNAMQAIDGPSAPGTPIQSTPEYVLNPLAIYRLARKAVPEKEKHAPELIASPEAHIAASDAASSSSWGHANFSPHIDQTQPVSSMLNTDGFQYDSTPRSALASGSDVGDLQMFFSSDFDTIWQPAETILETSQLGGIAPWESESSARVGFEANEFDVFMPNYAWPLPDL